MVVIWYFDVFCNTFSCQSETCWCISLRRNSKMNPVIWYDAMLAFPEINVFQKTIILCISLPYIDYICWVFLSYINCLIWFYWYGLLIFRLKLNIITWYALKIIPNGRIYQHIVNSNSLTLCNFINAKCIDKCMYYVFKWIAAHKSVLLIFVLVSADLPVTTRDLFVHAPSQWETTLHCNVGCHWLGAYTKWFLDQFLGQKWPGNNSV